MADAEKAAELQGLLAGGERRGSGESKTGDCCMEELCQQFITLGANRIEAFFPKVPKGSGNISRADARKRRRKKGQ